MDDPFFVRGFERFTDPLCDVQSLFDRNRTASDSVSQGFTLNQFQYQVSRFICFLQIVNGRDIRMVQRGEEFNSAAG